MNQRFKVWLLGLFFFIFALSLAAQEEQISYSEETGTLKRERFIDEFDYVFRTREELKDWWKLSIFNFAFEYERKLNPEWSTSLGVLPGSGLSIGGAFRRELNVLLESEGRWYYNMRKRIISGQGASNFSGSYAGLRLGKTLLFDIDDRSIFVEEDRPLWPNVELTYGLQLKIMNRSFIDFNIGTGIGEVFNYQFTADGVIRNADMEWMFNYRIKLGIILGSKIKELEGGVECDFFKCFQEEQLLFKIDLLNIVKGMTAYEQSGNLHFGLERKIGWSPFSVNVETGFGYRFTNPKYHPELSGSVITGSISVEPRYYHDLKRRIAQGLTANNISGSFVGLHFEAASERQYARNAVGLNVEWLQLNPMAGIQKRIFDKGFFEFKAGLGFRTLNGGLVDDQFFENFQFIVPVDIRIGLAF